MTGSRPPGAILLATDLSHRCDRALDRAVQLARSWGSKLLVVHAVEDVIDEYAHSHSAYDLPVWRKQTDPIHVARDRLYRNLPGEDQGIDIEIHVATGDPTQIVLQAASSAKCELIVTGVARDEILGRVILGDTVDRLARKSNVPVLVVRERPAGPYDHLLVATDFSPPARLALETAVQFFPDAAVALFHAYDLPFASYLGRSEIEKELLALEEEASTRFLEEAGLSPGVAANVVRIVERGVPEAMVGGLARPSGHHLTVVGSHGGGLLYHVLIGSTARKIMHAVEGDVLLVPSAGRPDT